jgi:hypothetical protein
MTAKIKLNSASGGGSFSLQAPSSSANNRVFTLPDIADATMATVNGITMLDQWRITAAKSNSGSSVFDANWERNDSSSEVLGTGVTESSGVFSFPSTGKYLIFASGYAYGNGDRYAGLWIEKSIDGGSNFTRAGEGYGSAYNSGNSTFLNVSFQYFMDVTNTSTHKIRLKNDNIGTVTWDGNTDIQRTGLTFMRIGDT